MATPDDPSRKTLQEILDIIDKHFTPKLFLIAERFRLMKRDQHESESIHIYLAELRRLSEHYDFGETFNDYLSNRLVCGMKSEITQEKLLSVKKLYVRKDI